jgi:hypothetical protein
VCNLKNILIGYQTGITDLKFGNYVNIINSPVVYWLSMALSLFVECLLLWLAVFTLISHLANNYQPLKWALGIQEKKGVIWILRLAN